MSIQRQWTCIAIVIVFLGVSSCKREQNEADESQPTAGPTPSQVAEAVEAITKGMQTTPFGSLSDTHVGQQCVVVTHSSNEDTRMGPPPPPLGMVRRLGQTTIYKGELCGRSPDGLKIRAAYPTSGNYKTVEIARADIQSVHLAK